MQRMTGAEALVATLKEEGVSVIFGIPGVQVMDAVRVVPVSEAGRVVQTELFPDIAVGDAPAGTQGG